VAPGCLDTPRARRAGRGADGGVDSVAVEAATLPRRDIFGGTSFRIVYRLIPNEDSPKRVKVIVIARRADNYVYLEALRRLGRERFVNLS